MRAHGTRQKAFGDLATDLGIGHHEPGDHERRDEHQRGDRETTERPQQLFRTGFHLSAVRTNERGQLPHRPMAIGQQSSCGVPCPGSIPRVAAEHERSLHPDAAERWSTYLQGSFR
jgi:hypothetical protein